MSPQRPAAVVVTALLGAAVIGAQYIAGKAARDTLFLTHFEVAALPGMIVVTSIFSIVLVVASSKALNRVAPATYVPLAFVASAILLIVDWAISYAAPDAAARILYLQVSGLGPLLGSGFWLIASERFDPRTAKRRFGQIAGAGTLGGLAGGLLAARLATSGDVTAMLPLLAVLNLLCAWQVRSLARSPDGSHRPHGALDPSPIEPQSGLRVLGQKPYLRDLAALVLLSTIAASLVDYAFQVQAQATFGRGPGLGRFFSLYYAAVSLVTFVVQAFGSRVVLERLGLAFSTSAPAVTVMAGGAVTLLAPGLPAVVVTRGAEAVSRGSLHAAGYELFYTPIAPRDKRAAKALIDVGVDRSGTIIGAGIVQVLLWLAPARQPATLLLLAIACSLVSLLVVRRVTRGYIKTLEQSLLNRAVELDVSDAEDLTTRTAILRTLQRPLAGGSGVDVEVQAIIALRSRDPGRVRSVLAGEKVLPATLVSHVIPLLAWDPVAPDAMRALRTIADQRVGELIDVLVDPNQPFVVRRRLARVFSNCASQRAVDGLLLGLDDLRFEVRFQCARSLVAIVEQNPHVVVDTARVLAAVRREVTVGRAVWEGRQLLDGVTGTGDGRSLLDEIGSERSRESLAHVFTLLSLVLPAEPMRIALRALQASDQGLRGTALEYLDGVLPPDIHDRLAPFLSDP